MKNGKLIMDDSMDNGKLTMDKSIDNGKLKVENEKNPQLPTVNSQLKKDWEIKKLGEVCEKIFAGGDKPKEFSKFKTNKYQIPIYANGERNNGLYGYTNVAKVEKPSITISGRGTIGYSEIRTQPFVPIVRLITLIPNNQIVDIKFIYYGLKNIDFTNSGSSIPQLTVPMVKEYSVPIPPLPEQKRIVAILDRAFEAIDKAKAIAQQNLKNAKEVFESYSRTLYERLISENKKELLGDLAKLVRGPFGGSLKKSMFVEKGYAVYEQRNAIGDFTDNFRYFIDEKKFNEMGRFSVKEGDMLMSCSGTIGKFTIIKDNYIKGIINQALLKISPDTSKIDNKFLLFVLSNFIQDGSSHSKGAAIKNIIAVKELKKIEIPLLTIEIQKQIVAQLDKLQTETKKLEAIYQKKIDNFEELKKSILQKAFNGEL